MDERKLPIKKMITYPLHLLGVVHQAGEDDDAEDEEEHQQSQLLGRRLERVDQDLQTGRVPRELEEPQYPDDAEEVQQLGLFLEYQDHVDVEAERGREVYDVHRGSEELDYVRGHLKRKIWFSGW